MSKKKKIKMSSFSAPLLKYVLVGVAFVIWVGFFDKNSFLLRNNLSQEIQELEKEYESLTMQRLDYIERLNSLQTEPERFAREEYFMHKSNEIVFILD